MHNAAEAIVLDRVAEHLQLARSRLTAHHLVGGDINRALFVDTGEQKLFVKWRQATSNALHLAELFALERLQEPGVVQVPRPIFSDHVGSLSMLVMDWLELAPLTDETQAQLGRQLARLHRQTSVRFGWEHDNFIGTTRQPNAWADHWLTFFREQRLGFLLDLLQQPTLLRLGGELMDALPQWFAGHQPQASLLHGDLWGGNAGRVCGTPVLYDPASYYGDRETDLAMMKLFGGFSSSCFAAYQKEWPLNAGSAQRIEVYQLYHILNHAVMFGAHYAADAQHRIERLLSQ